MFVLCYNLDTFKDGDILNIENGFTNKIYKSYDIDNYVINKDFLFDKSNVFFEDCNTLIYDIGNGLGFKIDKGLFNRVRQSYNIEEMISSLVLRQGNVMYTDFPIGVVSCNRRCVGQVIKLYKDYVCLYDVVNDDNLGLLYNKVLCIIDELLNNGILYLDIHEHNFLVSADLDVKLIDFESSCVIFDRFSVSDKIKCYEKIKNMFDRLKIEKVKIAHL